MIEMNFIILVVHEQMKPGRVVQSEMCLTADTCLTADPGV